MLKWELIDEPCTHRTKIFGGWLVKCTNDVYTMFNNYEGSFAQNGYEFRESITFVPDPNYEWKLDNQDER